MVPRFALVCIVLLLLPTSACGQELKPSTDEVTRDEFDQIKNLVESNSEAVKELTGILEQISDQLAANNNSGSDAPDIGPTPASYPSREPSCCSELRSRLSRLQYKVNNNLESRVAELERKADSFIAEQQDQGRRLRQIARLGNNGEHYPYTNASNDPARYHFRQTVKDTAPRYGTVFIRNLLPDHQDVRINGEWKRMYPGQEWRKRVERGTVTTQLGGQKPSYWTIGAPDYYQALDIHL
jgi:hypothetical protein